MSGVNLELMPNHLGSHTCFLELYLAYMFFEN